MKKLVVNIILLLSLLSSCAWSDDNKGIEETFTKELSQLQEYYSIPGMSAIVLEDNSIIYEQHMGHADIKEQIAVDSHTVFPIASITKTFSAVLLMTLVEEGKLSLDDPITKYYPESSLDLSIKVKHLLSHTSQGDIGKQFFYSSRFGLLTKVIEEASGHSYKTLMQKEILDPLELKSGFLLQDTSDLADRNVAMAKPYILEDRVQEGFIDFGYSASAGLAMTARDLARFDKALGMNELLSQESRDRMYQGLQEDLPYAYGLFRQRILDQEVLWVYGQYDCYSSLLLKVPAKNLTLILLANNNLMSDPARLIMGDATSSLFAHSFLKNYVFDMSQMPLYETLDSVYTADFEKDLYRQKVLAQALAESFMSRYDLAHMETSAALYKATFEKYPDYLSYSNVNLLHGLCFLKDVAFYRDLEEFTVFDHQIEQIGNHLLASTPNNPYLHSYMAVYHDRKGDLDKAKHLYQSIVNLENFSPNWYTREAQQWLDSRRDE